MELPFLNFKKVFWQYQNFCLKVYQILWVSMVTFIGNWMFCDIKRKEKWGRNYISANTIELIYKVALLRHQRVNWGCCIFFLKWSKHEWRWLLLNDVGSILPINTGRLIRSKTHCPELLPTTVHYHCTPNTSPELVQRMMALWWDSNSEIFMNQGQRRFIYGAIL